MLQYERTAPYDLAELFHKAYSQVTNIDNARSGFRTSGIWPYQPSKFTKDLVPSTHHLPIVVINENERNHPNTSAASETDSMPNDSGTSTPLQKVKHEVIASASAVQRFELYSNIKSN